MSHTTTQYSRTIEQAFYPSYERALLDMACKAEGLTGVRVSPDAFRHMVRHAYASTWQAVWSDALLVMCVELADHSAVPDCGAVCPATNGGAA